MPAPAAAEALIQYCADPNTVPARGPPVQDCGPAHCPPGTTRAHTARRPNGYLIELRLRRHSKVTVASPK
ncbi:hypothetical protein FRAHR75_40159 [Frankia sp. Hr75.2]|nr:hypothetical protein FRAHR75_40159 [Frankia sp. Hr75.2]SQD99208.1 hypothetical protein FMEAI12_5150012 [Parafrankia sp. Ea1.12]